MPNQISQLFDLVQSLRVSAAKFCDWVEFNDQNIDHNDVEKVRHLIEAESHSLEETAVSIDDLRDEVTARNIGNLNRDDTKGVP
jgi:hypothetical protein